MQLGARWRAGDPPHRSVPEALVSAIAACERKHPEGDSWTITWLEGRPRLQFDDLIEVRMTAQGSIETIFLSEESEDTRNPTAGDEDVDDDDWLLTP